MAKKAISKAKANLIKKIKDIITDYGSFTTADVEATSSPVTASIGKHTFQLAERFSLDSVEAVTYVHDHETDTENIAYEDLQLGTLKDILELAKEYKEFQKDWA